MTAYALGGMNATQWRRLGGFVAADGYGAIGAFGPAPRVDGVIEHG